MSNAKTTAQDNRLTETVKKSKTGNNPCRCLSNVTGDPRCGRKTRSRFAQGHDATTKATLIEAYRAGGRDATVELDGAKLKVGELADALGWAHQLTASPAQKRAEARAAKEEATPAPKVTKRAPRATKAKVTVAS
jgi:hypothetical protein